MSTTEQTTKKNFTNYKVFGFWLAKCFKDQGIIDQDGHDAWIKAQEIHGSKEAQEEFYGKFFESIPVITQEIKDLVKTTKIENKVNDKQAKKDAAKAAKLAEKEAAKAEKLAAKEAAKAEKLAAKELAKAEKLAEKEATKAEKLAAKSEKMVKKLEKKLSKKVKKDNLTTVSDSDAEEAPSRPNTPVVEESNEHVVEVTTPVAKEIADETDKLMDGLLQEVLAETARETNSDELVKEEYVENMSYLEVTDPKKKKTMYIRRPVQINNILFADPEMKEQIKGFCVLSEAKESSDPIFQYQRGKKIK
jgi:hypothetical protein